MADRRDPRFGGNMEVANTGIPYPTGGRDVRFEGSLPHQFQYRDQGRTVVSDTEPAFTDMGRNYNWAAPSSGTPNFRQTYPHELQHQGIPKQHPNPRMRGMMGGLGGLQEQAAVDPSDWRTILRILEAGGDPGTETAGIGSTNEYQMAELSNKQGNFMESGLGNPNWYSNFPDYFDTVTGKGDWKQKLGWKDEATEQEVIDKLNQMMLDRDQSLPWSTTT